jgi:hypothetical protein
LGFDFTFRSGYQVSIAMNDLADAGDLLKIVFRVVSESRRDAPVYFVQKFHVPLLEDNAKGRAELMGTFLVGEGKYHVDWLMRDIHERFCASSWDVEARLDAKDAPMSRNMAPAMIQPVVSPFSADESRAEYDRRGTLLKVVIIMNFAPQNRRAATLSETDMEDLAAILRKIGDDSRICSYSLLACSIQTRQVLYRQSNADRIDLPALGGALKSLNFARVDARQLAVKDGDAAFLGNLTRQALIKDNDADGLIFVSPKYPLDVEVSRETIDSLRLLDRPVFYLNYNLEPALFPWRCDRAPGKRSGRLRIYDQPPSGPFQRLVRNSRTYADITLTTTSSRQRPEFRAYSVTERSRSRTTPKPRADEHGSESRPQNGCADAAAEMREQLFGVTVMNLLLAGPIGV